MRATREDVHSPRWTQDEKAIREYQDFVSQGGK